MHVDSRLVRLFATVPLSRESEVEQRRRKTKKRICRQLFLRLEQQHTRFIMSSTARVKNDRSFIDRHLDTYFYGSRNKWTINAGNLKIQTHPSQKPTLCVPLNSRPIRDERRFAYSRARRAKGEDDGRSTFSDCIVGIGTFKWNSKSQRRVSKYRRRVGIVFFFCVKSQLTDLYIVPKEHANIKNKWFILYEMSYGIFVDLDQTRLIHERPGRAGLGFAASRWLASNVCAARYTFTSLTTAGHRVSFTVFSSLAWKPSGNFVANSWKIVL